MTSLDGEGAAECESTKVLPNVVPFGDLAIYIFPSPWTVQ